MSLKVYAIITERITKALEAGVVPWHKTWTTSDLVPQNLISKKPYRGVNVWLTAMAGFTSPYWVTFKQTQALGGRIAKGSKGTPVVFWNFLEKEVTRDGERRVETIPLARYYTVFNVEQTEGLETHIPKPAPGPAFNAIDAAENIVLGFRDCPAIKHGGARAFYRPSADFIGMPPREAFDGPEAYYATLFHEMTHATGHVLRLNREGIHDAHFFGDAVYSREELVAEMGAAFLCGVAGIENQTVNNSAAYIQSWLKALRNDHRMVIQAAGQAQKAADYIQGITHENEEQKAA